MCLCFTQDKKKRDLFHSERKRVSTLLFIEERERERGWCALCSLAFSHNKRQFTTHQWPTCSSLPFSLEEKKNGFYSYHIVVPVRLRWIKWKRRAKSEGGKKREDKQIKVTAPEVTVKEKRNGYQKVNNVTRSGTSPSRLEQWQKKKNRKRARTENAEYHKEDMSKKQDTMVWKPYGRKK